MSYYEMMKFRYSRKDILLPKAGKNYYMSWVKDLILG